MSFPILNQQPKDWAPGAMYYSWATTPTMPFRGHALTQPLGSAVGPTVAAPFEAKTEKTK